MLLAPAVGRGLNRVTRKKFTGSELSVFKGREARLNLAIFLALVTAGSINH